MGYHITAVGSAFDAGHIENIRNTAASLGCTVRFCPDWDSSLPHLAQTEILFAPSDSRSPSMVPEMPHLKWFSSYYAGVDPLVVPGVLPEGVLLTNGSGAYGITIAEHIIMVSLMMMRRMPEYEHFVRTRQFRSDLVIGSLYDANVVVCGTGDIGTQFAKRVRAFCPASVIGLNRTGHDAEGFDRVLPMSRLDEVLPQADLLVLTLPGTPHTDDLLTAGRIASMKKTAFLVNVGRGNCIDQNALIDALKAGNLAGAALDVFRTEPIPENDPAWNTPGLLVTPHCSGKMTMQYTRDTLVDGFCENLRRFCTGEPMHNVVDFSLGY